MLELTDVLAETFDIIKGLLIGEGAKFKLLREAGDTETFEDVIEVAVGWRPKYSEFFGNTTLEVADVTTDFASKVKESTHLVITGSGVPSLNNVIYELLAETTAPDADRPYWRIRVRSVGRKYVGGEEV